MDRAENTYISGMVFFFAADIPEKHNSQTYTQTHYKHNQDVSGLYNKSYRLKKNISGARKINSEPPKYLLQGLKAIFEWKRRQPCFYMAVNSST